MQEEKDHNDLIFDEAPPPGALGRWLPALVVFCVVGGFVALAWYAYHAGTQSVKDEDLLVVEADKTPMKEKPLDPGGMKFPDQDKTIFDTFAGNGQQQPKVERVLPSPEEPMPKEMDTSGTTTWVNDKLHADNAASPEQMIGSDEKKQEAAPLAKVAAMEKSPPADDGKTETYVARNAAPPIPDPVVDNGIVPEKPPVAKEPAVKDKTLAKPSKPAAAYGGAMAQLGAYRSEKEANAAWKKMENNQPTLSGHEPSIVKADLGERGIYFRLRVGGFSATDEARAFCAKLTAAGQSCIAVADK